MTNTQKEWAKQRQKFVALHARGKSVRDIANAYGLSTQRVYAALKREGVTFNKGANK